MEQVRVGILGTSWWADAMYLPALKNHPKASIEAVAGRNPEPTRAFASRWEIRKKYENAEDLIELDVEARKMDLLCESDELEERKNRWQAPESRYRRGFARLYQEHVSQANLGCEFDFLLGTPGETREPDIF